jgi:hypothetical protein
MDDPSDSEPILLRLPIWTFWPLHGKIDGVIRITGTKGETGLPIFTDEDLAERFRKAGKVPRGLRIREMSDPLACYGLVTLLQEKGFTYVFVDPTAGKKTLDRTKIEDAKAFFKGYLE